MTIAIYQSCVAALKKAEGIPLLLLRLYLAPVMAQAGWNKAMAFESTSAWFGSSDWGLGLPFPDIMASLAIAAEAGGGIFLLLGLLTRLVSIPLIVTMLVAIFSVHAENGWLAIADPTSWLADGTLYLDEQVLATPEKLEAARSLLQHHGHYDWLTDSGKFVILNNGIEFAATYLIMLLVLFFYGGGQFVSADYWLSKRN
ncbi:HvfX family Cu-binding RiPP maturation protein [Alteromonas halophila]|uniref:DoxX family protein n=1 Tax=Alteromonas halophila TaxID=516698 RepID=A0A918JEM6_9ALTE|nr:DoxX family protein [Alteromonas halophila]GGW76930.1 hypothetical protein GCM10007391_07260 [Alteromonas halophila]